MGKTGTSKPMGTPVIVLSHGSRHPQADTVIDHIAEAARHSSGRDIQVAHLDFSELTLERAARTLASAGHRTAVVVPLLFTNAFHMRHDVPEVVASAARATDMSLHLAPGLGTGPDMANVVAQQIADHAQLGGVKRLALYSVGSSIPGVNNTVADFATQVAILISRMQGAPVSARAFVATGPTANPDAFHSYIDETTVVQPLFVAPGTLWDCQRERITTGWTSQHLGVALLPIVLQRAEEAIA